VYRLTYSHIIPQPPQTMTTLPHCGEMREVCLSLIHAIYYHRDALPLVSVG